MKREKLTSEAALAEVVTTWLRADGWRTYHEVELRRGGRADIVAVRRGLVWILETKLRGGLEVLDQALDRQRCGAHGVLVAVPAGPSSRLLAGLCSRVGVGAVFVEQCTHWDAHARVAIPGWVAKLDTWPAFDRRARARKLLADLRPEHERTPAGATSQVRHWTPFKEAVRGVVYDLAAKPGHTILLAELALADAVRDYKRGFAAPQLRRWLGWAVGAGLVPGCSFVEIGGKRAVWLDVAAVTTQHVADFQLDQLRVKLSATPVVGGA